MIIVYACQDCPKPCPQHCNSCMALKRVDPLNLNQFQTFSKLTFPELGYIPSPIPSPICSDNFDWLRSKVPDGTFGILR